MYASFNRFDHNVYRDATIVTTLDTFTSMLAGCTIFGILGHLAHESGTTNIGEVVEAGAGLAFISYPDAIAKFKFLPQVSLSGKSFFHRLVADSLFCVFNSSQYAGFRPILTNGKRSTTRSKELQSTQKIGMSNPLVWIECVPIHFLGEFFENHPIMWPTSIVKLSQKVDRNLLYPHKWTTIGHFRFLCS